MILEQVFINNGDLYKEVEIFTGPKNDAYTYKDSDDPVAPYYKEVDGNKKRYITTQAMRDFLGIDNNAPTADLSAVDVCPSLTLSAALAYVENTLDTELYFRIDNTAAVKTIAEYYNLNYPITKEIEYLIDNEPSKISYFWNNTEEFILGSVKFYDSNPTMFKVYALYKDHEHWNLVNRGRVFKEGLVVEEGGWYFDRLTPEKYESSTETSTTVYLPAKDNKDPLANWEAHITYKDGSTDTRFYESSKMVRQAICNLTSGSNYEEFDKAPQVTWWLGRSYYDKSAEQELYFHVESKEMLDQVCEYYNLPVPYSADLESILLYNKEYIRFKSYDLLQLGEGNFVEVVVASVTFEGNTPTSIKLYETVRPYK